MPIPFSLGVNYWPRRSATAMWRTFDPGEIGADFGQIAALGLDTVRVFLRWDDFAPYADAIDQTMLERFEIVVAIASANGLRIMPTLFCGHMSGVNFLPAWSLDRQRRRGRFRTIVGDTASPYAAGNIYAGALLDAQVRFARAVGERLRAHPAIVAWDIGHAVGRVCEPSDTKVNSGDHSTAPASEHEVAEWSRRLAGSLREASGLPVTAGTSSDVLTTDRSVRLGSLCAPFAFASMQGDTLTSAFARNRLDPEVVPFLALLTASFSYKPVLITGLGNPSCPPGKFSAFERFALPDEPPLFSVSPDDTVFGTFPCLTEDETAVYCREVLERLHADGRLGAYWWCWSDYGENVSARPPFDEAPYERWFGIVRQDGSEKPVAAALAKFARERREVVKAHDMSMIAAAYYYRTLPTSSKTVYEAFLGSREGARQSR